MRHHGAISLKGTRVRFPLLAVALAKAGSPAPFDKKRRFDRMYRIYRIKSFGGFRILFILYILSIHFRNRRDKPWFSG